MFLPLVLQWCEGRHVYCLNISQNLSRYQDLFTNYPIDTKGNLSHSTILFSVMLAL
ncbi:protein of unknown function [Xenorhabdus poinarii G6]|uniref:Uncharacterized protein n=1 Tax=Xenorhabdus poinarii G6 TaxID=1354304 RepID=A0A068QZS3_9GAMM|nr:protein of unknown function [Xenorhabdus poinarii G6]